MTIVRVGAVPIVEARATAVERRVDLRDNNKQGASNKASVMIHKQKIPSAPPSPRSMRTMKKHQHKLEQKQANASSQRKLFFGLLVALYLLVALSFCLQFVLSPERAQHLTKASLATQAPMDRHMYVQSTYSNGAVKQERVHQLLKQHHIQHPMAPSSSAVAKGGQQKSQINFEQGSFDGVQYYRCDVKKIPLVGSLQAAVSEAPMPVGGFDQVHDEKRDETPSSRDMVILDGKRFFDKSKVGRGGKLDIASEDYRNGETILQLCGQAAKNRVLDSIIVLEMDGTEDPKKLMITLEELLNGNKISSLPVAALVTPGRSSSLVLDWILYEDFATLSTRVAQHWIPIAAGSTVLQALGDGNDDMSVALQNIVSNNRSDHPLHVMDDWPTLAVHCTGDDNPSWVELLGASTSTGEVEGGSNCLVEEPSAMATALLDYLGEMLQPVRSSLSMEANARVNSGQCSASPPVCCTRCCTTPVCTSTGTSSNFAV